MSNNIISYQRSFQESQEIFFLYVCVLMPIYRLSFTF